MSDMLLLSFIVNCCFLQKGFDMSLKKRKTKKFDVIFHFSLPNFL